MARFVVDVENKFSVIAREGKTRKTDNMPFSGRNFLVSVGVEDIDTGEKWYWREEAKLDSATLLVGHFLKHDIIWLRASGFTIKTRNFWDTAIPEYVMNRGQTAPLSLKELCIKYDLPRKKTDLTEKYLEEDIGFEAMPVEIVEEYGLGDITSTAALFREQEAQLRLQDNIGLVPTVQMMNEFMWVLSKWQANGIKIDVVELERVKAEYVAEQKQLQTDLNNLARKVMGDTPFSLTSNVDKSVLIYSRRVKNRAEWVKRFGIGTDDSGKALKRPRFKDGEFVSTVKELTEIEYRTKAAQCQTCLGTGKVAKPLKNGTMGKPRFICKDCSGAGIVYTKTGKVAGFKFKPANYKATTANGFDTDKGTLELLAKTAEGDAKLFLDKMRRLNAVNVYISTFCDGILNGVTKDCVLYTNFNQCITATARLSSTDPNFQNQPRGKTFPVRRAIVSRFVGGSIIEGDFAQLEFRVAGELSGDKQVLEDLINKVDAHAFTRDTLIAAGMVVDRQDAKPHTFKPLYGGEYGTPAEMAYYRAFKLKFKGVAEWQSTISEIVLRRKVLTLPSGREYCWPRAERRWDGKVDFFTQIVNYPVQGFATADIVPIACIRLERRMEELALKSVAFLTVHDSIAVDAYPGEEGIVAPLLADCMLEVKQEMLERYNYDFKMPLEVEVKEGVNWLDTKVVLKKAHEYHVPKPTNDKFNDPLPEFMVA
jgi:DNA polymerase I-like protein with 3'-5' exonuclease and polymerase domains